MTTKAFPKIIHQVFGFWDNKIPKHIQKRMDTWKTLHPSYEYMLWDKKKSRAFLKQHFSWFLSIYDSYPYQIQKADAVRYFILYHYGGIYSDIDLEPVKPLDTLLQKHKNKGCILYRSSNSELLTNDFMISKPKNPFWKRVWHELILSCNLSSMSKHLTVMNTTGPLMLDLAFDKYLVKKKNVVYIIHAKYINNCDISKVKPCYNKEAYLKRYDGNSWHSADSTVFNFFYKYYILILGVIISILILVLILKTQ